MEGASNCLKILQAEICPTAQNLKHSVGELQTTSKKNRFYCLISKTVATSSGGVGTCLTMGAGIAALTAATGGLALVPLAIAGATLGTGGAITGVITRICDKNRRKKFITSLENQVEMFLSTRKNFYDELGKYPALQQALAIQMEGHVDPVTSNPKYVTQWLTLKQFTDTKIQIEDLKPGDHIYRGVSKRFQSRFKNVCLLKRFVFHHGIFLGDGLVAEFTQVLGQEPKPRIAGIKDFFDPNCHLLRRSYHGFELPLEETIDRALYIVSQEKWNSYNILENNCEHFATFLKLKSDFMFSEQASKAKKIGKGVAKGMGASSKSAQGVFDGLLVAGSILSKPALANTAGAVGRVVAPRVFALTLTGVIAAPILTAFDIAVLVHDFKSKQPDITRINDASAAADDIIHYFQKLEQCLLKLLNN